MSGLDLDKVRGCLLGGAVGDAIGGVIEFHSLAEIHARFGPRGIRDHDVAYGRIGAITDDTQMTLFTAEALIRAQVHNTDQRTELHRAYLRWLRTQTDSSADTADGWLLDQQVLHVRRAPGNTCLSALRSGRAGTTRTPINDSKGCGGVMRAAPAGFVAIDDAFELGCDLAAITHGHPAGYLPAGVLASAVAYVLDGAPIDDALASARTQLLTWPENDETLRALDAGIALGRAGVPTGEQLERLGGGWTGEEALAIAVACVLGAPHFEAALIAAVNHSGDSDSTGSIAGNLRGASTGLAAIPAEWLDQLEATDVIEQIAYDCRAVLGANGTIEDAVTARHGLRADTR